MASGPVFIVGMNGSGTTMLADSLGRHPDLYIFPRESKVIPFFLKTSAQFGDLSVPENRRKLANAIGRSRPYWKVNRKRPLMPDESCLENCRTCGDIVSCLYLSLAKRRKKARWGDKSPANTLHIALLAEGFHTAQFIHIIRDGRDVAQSLHRRWRYKPAHTIWRWKQVVRIGRQQGAALGPSRYLEVRYESLTTSPEACMRDICAFLEIEFHPSVIESSMRHMDRSAQRHDIGKIVKNSGKWKEYFSEPQIARLESLSGGLLNELNYETRLTDDRDLGFVKLCLFRTLDGLMFARFLFQRFGVRSPAAYVGSISVAIKQWSVTRYRGGG